MLASLTATAMAQAHTTITTMGDIVWLLNYAKTHFDATLHYHSSNMILHVASNASYLYKECARSQAGGHFFLANQLVDNGDKPTTLTTNNVAIHTQCHIIKTVMSSATEAKIGATFLNTKDASPIRTTLEEIGNPQPPTPMQVDNTTAMGFSKNNINQKRSKAIGMRFYWIRDRTRQGHFNIYWDPISTNLGDYHTKHHSPGHHQLIRPHFLQDEPHVHLDNLVVMHILQGCANYRRMRAVFAEPEINSKIHITAVNPFKPVFLASHTHKLINNVFISYDFHMIQLQHMWYKCVKANNNTSTTMNQNSRGKFLKIDTDQLAVV